MVRFVAPEHRADGTIGAANYEIGHYNQMVAEADRLGLQVITHSVGDMGVRRVLDAYQEAQRRNGSVLTTALLGAVVSTADRQERMRRWSTRKG